jgi:transcriptional regulator with XRE-family HTH domain
MASKQQNPIRQYREQHGLSQEAMAEVLGVSRGLVSLIETGERPITPENAKEWEPKLGIPRETLCPEIFKRAAA